MMDNPDHGIIIFDLLRKADDGDGGPLAAYLAADPTRAASADRGYMLAVRQQFGTVAEGRWYCLSTQSEKNPWPGAPTRSALVLLRGETGGRISWHDFTLPAGTHIEGIRAEGETFRIRGHDVDITTTGDDIFRVIADCSFGPRGVSDVDIARGFDKLAGRAPLDVVRPAASDAILGTALPLVFNDPTLGRFEFWPNRPARYLQTREYEPSYSLFTDLSGRFDSALARAREILPGIEVQVAAGARLVQAIKPDFGKSDAPRLIGAQFRHDGIVHISIDDGFDSSVSADLELGTDGKLRLIEIEGNN